VRDKRNASTRLFMGLHTDIYWTITLFHRNMRTKELMMMMRRTMVKLYKRSVRLELPMRDLNIYYCKTFYFATVNGGEVRAKTAPDIGK